MAVQVNRFIQFIETREVIAILDGDTKYGNYKFDNETTVTVAMPYLSGSDLCGISTLFGLPMTYKWCGVNLSRWLYLDNLLEQ